MVGIGEESHAGFLWRSPDEVGRYLALAAIYRFYDLAFWLLDRPETRSVLEGSRIAALQEAVRLDPKQPESRSALGIAYARVDALNEARNELDEAAVLDPTSARIENNRGNVLRHVRRLVAATEDR